MLQYRWRISAGGCPHVLMRNERGHVVSICWMNTKRFFRVFTNYGFVRSPSKHRHGGKLLSQERFDFAEVGDAVNFARMHLTSLAVISV